MDLDVSSRLIAPIPLIFQKCALYPELHHMEESSVKEAEDDKEKQWIETVGDDCRDKGLNTV